MKIKQFFFVPVALTVAFLFSYCTKEQQPNLTPKEVNNPGTVSSRNQCTVGVTVLDGEVDVCGTNNAIAVCAIVNGITLHGTESLAAFGNSQGSYDYWIPQGDVALIRLSSALGAKVEVRTSGGSSQTYTLAPGVPITITVDSNCSI